MVSRTLSCISVLLELRFQLRLCRSYLTSDFSFLCRTVLFASNFWVLLYPILPWILALKAYMFEFNFDPD